jgi:aconitase A
VEAIRPGSWTTLPYTSRVHAENLVRRSDPAHLTEYLTQIIERKRERDFPWFPARVVCHDILGQTALVDLAGLRDAIAEQGGDPAAVNPVVPVQLIVDHSLAVECGGYDRRPSRKTAPSKTGAMRTAFISSTGASGLQECGGDSAGQRHHAPDQSGAHEPCDPCYRW